MAYLHRIRSPGTWNPTLVPTCQVKLDTTHPLAGGLVACWLPGIGYVDFSGNNNTLSATAPFSAAPSFVAGPRGPAVKFSGAQNLGCTIGPSLKNQNLTQIIWVIPTTSNSDGALTGSYSAGGGDPELRIYNGNLNFLSQGVVGLALASVGPAMNVVSQCAAAWAGGTGGAVYMNGASVATGSSGYTFNFSSIFTLGSGTSYGGNEPYIGLIDHVKIYNRVLSANEIAWEKAEPFSIFAPVVRRQYYLSGSAWSAIFMASSFSGSSSPGNTARSGLVLSTDIDAALAVAKVARAASVQAVDIDAISAAARAGRGSVAISSDTDTTYGIAKIGRGSVAISSDTDTTYGIAKIGRGSVAISSDTDTTYGIAKIGRGGNANSADASSQTAAAKAGRGGVALTSAGISGAPALGRAARVANAIGAGASALYAAASKASVGGHPASVLFSSLSAIGASAKTARSSLAEVWAISTASAAGKSARLGKIQSVDASSTSAIARVGRVGSATSTSISGAPARASAARSAKAISAGISAAVALAAKQTSAGTAWFGSHTTTGISALTGRATVARKGLSVVGSVSASTLKSAVARVGRSAASALSGFVSFWGGSLTPSTWTPSQRRTVRWIDYQALGGMGVMAAKAAMQWPTKRAADADDFVVDYSGLLTDCGDTLTGVSVTCSPSDLTVVWAATFGTNAVAFLSCGTAGQDYSVTVTATTAQGRVVNSIVQLQVTT